VEQTTDSLVEQRLEGALVRKNDLFGGPDFWLVWPSRDAAGCLATSIETAKKLHQAMAAFGPSGRAHALSSDCVCRKTFVSFGEAQGATLAHQVRATSATASA
jgi:hypothetical protein